MSLGYRKEETLRELNDTEQMINRQNLSEFLWEMEFIGDGTDCGDIAEEFLELAGRGKIISIYPKDKKEITLLEYGAEKNFVYHCIYSDGELVYDPRYSREPVKEEKYFEIIDKLNGDKNYLKIEE